MRSSRYLKFSIVAIIAAYMIGYVQASCNRAAASSTQKVEQTLPEREPMLECAQFENPAPQVIEVPCVYVGTEMDRYNDHAYLHDLGFEVTREEQWLMQCLNECYEYLDFRDCAVDCMAKEVHLTCK